LGQEPRDNATFIHDLKVRLTAISGYAQLLERQINESEYATEQQREYLARLRRVIDDLSRTIREHEAETRTQRSSRPDSGNGEGSSEPCNSGYMSR
jgi:signal transduction histidine kinase